MPGQGMAPDHHPVLFRKINNIIPGAKIVRMLITADGIPLHDILRHYGVKFALKYLDVLLVVGKHSRTVANRCADIKIELFRQVF